MTGGKFKLTKGYRELIEAAREEAQGLGLTVDYTLEGRHPKLHISDGTREITLPFSSTPRVQMQAEFGRRKIRSAARVLAAKAMETGTAKTEGLGAKHDSAVACDLPDASNPSPQTPQEQDQ